MKKIAIWGGTGLIGRHLVNELQNDHEVMVISRNQKKAEIMFNGKIQAFKDVPGSVPDAIINLSGENVGKKLWTKTQKEKIRYSRIITTRNIINYINSLENPPEALIQASAIGFYGNSLGDTFDENGSKGRGFLADVTAEWESETEDLRDDVRKVIIRTGVVLSKEGGVLKKLSLPFKLFAGGHIGNGKQWVSWIHISDEVNAIRFLLENKEVQGIFNLTSPDPVTFREFAHSIGYTMKRPSWLNMPSSMVKLFFGEMGREILLGGQKVYPEKLLENNFKFSYPHILPALKNLLK